MNDKDTEGELTSEEQAFHDGYDTTLTFLENRIQLSN